MSIWWLSYFPISLFVWGISRKWMADLQARVGPTYAGRRGTLQGVADFVKLLSREGAPRDHYRLVWILFCSLSLGILAQLLPGVSSGTPEFDSDWMIWFTTGVVLFSLFSLLMMTTEETLRMARVALFQSIAPVLVLSILTAAISTHGYSRSDFFLAQSGGFWHWNAFRTPADFFSAIVCTLGVVVLGSEVTLGRNDPRQSNTFGFSFLIDRILSWCVFTFLISLVVLIWWGGPHLFPVEMDTFFGAVGFFAALAKVFLIFILALVYRGTGPRPRFDQLTQLAWKVLTPLSTGLFLVRVVLGAIGGTA